MAVLVFDSVVFSVPTIIMGIIAVGGLPRQVAIYPTSSTLTVSPQSSKQRA